MALSKQISPSTSNFLKKNNIWFERGMAIFALLNYIVVLFNYTYIPLRDFWLQGRMSLINFKLGDFEYQFPQEPMIVHQLPIAQLYDPVKGIEANRDTQEYLKRVEEFEKELSSFRSPQVTEILAGLRDRSNEMIDTNPFQVANKTGTLERIKNLMRERVTKADGSAKEAFNIFWSQDYLSQKSASEELEFFNKRVRPLMETNYFRPIGENGEPFDNFGLVDFPFTALFLLEFLARSWFISRQRKGVSWLDAMLWRWYDILLFFPVLYWLRPIRLLRIIPVTIRLHQAKIIDLQKIKKQASQGFVAGIAEDLTEVVVVGVLNQVQGSIQRGEFTNVLAQEDNNTYIDLNNTNEVAEITRLVVQLVVNKVLPAVEKDIESLLQYSLEKAIKEAPGYQNLKMIPGVEKTTKTLIQQTIAQTYNILYAQIKQLIEEDPEFDKLLEKLVETFTKSMRTEIKGKQSIERLEYLLVALIEEVKINYVQRLSEEDMEALMDQTRALRQVTQVSSQ
ncbi:hypothetical protein [Spirulina sp. 06S082]|uniref:hypothetical protein n=1 Tax=Spirulina sp. 06S082 TaxID=3110248 RepID=UPI002B2144D1|nr:hypothetical protein [Spirulina sp. 06S082]MEA5472130.1 hypothetical protein [Spirulina sp. 06S082]